MGKRLIWVLALLAATTCGAAEPAGYVLEVQGRWLQKGELAPLTVGTPVSAGSQIVAPTPAAGDRLTVVAARTGSVLLARRCDEPTACRGPLTMPDAPAAATPGFLQRVFGALADQPDRYVATLNRATMSAHDEVLIWEAGRVDLGPMLAGRPEGVYELTLAPLDCPTGVRCADAPVDATLVWSPRAPVATIELARPGLFELSLRRSGRSAALPAERSWVLATTRAGASAARERLHAAAALADSWGVVVDEDAKRAFIRAVMSTSDR